MKNYYTLLLLLWLPFSTLIAQSNNKFDKIITKDYEILEVNIKKISENYIEFCYPNEETINNLELKNIAKIIYKSGRIQEIKTPQKTDSTNNSSSLSKVESEKDIQKQELPKTPIKQNTIAVLPVPFFNIESMISVSEAAKTAQNDIYNQLIQSASNLAPLSIQDIRTTNSLLKKAGLDYANIDEVEIQVLQDILGVDNIIACKVNFEIKKSNVEISNMRIDESKNNTNMGSSTVVTENKEYTYKVYFDMYKNNDKIYTKVRVPFFDDIDSWKDAVFYLLKRSPIYVK